MWEKVPPIGVKHLGQNVQQLGSVWIGLILLKLKTYCWNHCSKIIFKCINSTVGPIFNEKIDKKWNLWVREQCTDALFTKKVNICGYCSLNSSHTPPKTRENKKNKIKSKRGLWNVNPNRGLISIWESFFDVKDDRRLSR